MRTWYNDNDAYCAGWLRNLIAGGMLPDGDVSDADMREVQADDIRGYDTAHWFAGIGGWPWALRLAGWPDDRPVWTASLPCQPFSAAGKSGGVGDERHLWPAFRGHVSERRPPVIFGEQVASKAGRLWFSGVRADLEALGYAVGAADLAAASIGAPHIRQRLFWVAHSLRERGPGGEVHGRDYSAAHGTRTACASRSGGQNYPCRVADSQDATRRRAGYPRDAGRRAQEAGRPGVAGGVGDANGQRRQGYPVRGCQQPPESTGAWVEQPEGNGRQQRGSEPGGRGIEPRRSVDAERNGGGPDLTGWGPEGRDADWWADSYWVECADGKARRAGTGVQPLAPSVPGRVGKLRAYGNSIVPPLAAEFVRGYLDA